MKKIFFILVFVLLALPLSPALAFTDKNVKIKSGLGSLARGGEFDTALSGCKGDLDHDGRITTIDLNLLLAIWGLTKDDMSPVFWWTVGWFADANNNEIIDHGDLGHILSKLNTTCH